MEKLKSILEILGILSIPSILWNIFLYCKNKQYKKLNTRKELKRLEMRKDRLLMKFAEDTKNLNVGYSEGKYNHLDTESEKIIALERELGDLQENHYQDICEIEANIEYYEKLK